MPDKSERICGITSIVLTIMNTTGLLLFAVGFVQVRAAFTAVYVDLEVALPGITQFTLSIPTAIFFLLVLVILAALVAKEFLRPKWLPLVLNAIWMAIAGVLLAFFTLAMFVPLVKLIEHTGTMYD